MRIATSPRTATFVEHLIVTIVSIGTNKFIQGYLCDVVGLVSDHWNKISILIKQVITFMQVEGLAFHVVENATPVKHDKRRYTVF